MTFPSFLRPFGQRSHRPSRRPHSSRTLLRVEALEERALLSGSDPTVLMSGATEVPESPYGTYALRLTVVDPENDPVGDWTINWGDGVIDTLPGNTPTATHAYSNGPAVRTIEASVVVDGQPFTAHVSEAGAPLGTFATPGGGQSAPAYMSFGRSDNGDPVSDLYVGSIDSHDVAVYDGLTGVYLRTLITAADGLARPTMVVFGPDDNLYVSGQGSGNVLRYDFATDTVLPFISGIGSPHALAFDSDGNLYVAQESPTPNPDLIRPQILRRDRVTGELSVFVDLPNAGLLGTWGMVLRGPSLYVGSENRVARFDSTDGTPQPDFFPAGSGGLIGAAGMSFGPDGDLYVASYTSSGPPFVARYHGATGEFRGTITGGGMDLPVDVTFGTDANGDGWPEMYVSSERTNSILRYAGPLTATAATTLGVTVLDIQTKFYVPNDGASNLTYEYAIGSTPVESYALDGGNSAPRGAASNAAGNKVWVVDASKKVFVYDPAGTPLGSWTLGGLSGSAQVEDLATNGTDIWIVDAKQDKVFRYAGAASRISGSQNAASSFSLNSGNKNPKGIVTDGASLWVVDDAGTDKVFKYTLAGSLLGSWTLTAGGGSPTGITLDPSAPAHLWIVDSGSDRVYQYDNAVGLTTGSQSASTNFALAAGNTNPQGIADPPPAAAPPDDQGEQGGMDLLTGIMHEMGHVLGLSDDVEGVMQETMPTGMRFTPLTEAVAGPGLPSSETRSEAMVPANIHKTRRPTADGDRDLVFPGVADRSSDWDLVVALALTAEQQRKRNR